MIAQKESVSPVRMDMFHPSLCSALTVELIVRVVQKLHVRVAHQNILLTQLANVHSVLIGVINVLALQSVQNVFLDLHLVQREFANPA